MQTSIDQYMYIQGPYNSPQQVTRVLSRAN
jgi:hypothetical protein